MHEDLRNRGMHSLLLLYVRSERARSFVPIGATNDNSIYSHETGQRSACLQRRAASALRPYIPATRLLLSCYSTGMNKGRKWARSISEEKKRLKGLSTCLSHPCSWFIALQPGASLLYKFLVFLGPLVSCPPCPVWLNIHTSTSTSTQSDALQTVRHCIHSHARCVTEQSGDRADT